MKHCPFPARRRNMAAYFSGRSAGSSTSTSASITYSTSRSSVAARCWRSSSTYRPSVPVPDFIADLAARSGILEATSLRRTLVKRIGLNTRSRVTTQRICGFQQTASRMPRAAEGVITS